MSINEKNYKEELKGLCCVEVSGESCANCLTLMPILQDLCKARGDVRLVHVEADYSTLPLMEVWDVEKVEVLPYHTMGVVKYEKLGMEYPLKDVSAPSKERVMNAKSILQK